MVPFQLPKQAFTKVCCPYEAEIANNKHRIKKAIFFIEKQKLKVQLSTYTGTRATVTFISYKSTTNQIKYLTMYMSVMFYLTKPSYKPEMVGCYSNTLNSSKTRLL